MHNLVHTGEGWEDYLKRMEKSGQWGSHIELNAAANLLATPILVVTDSEGVDKCQIWIYPSDPTTSNVLLLGFHTELHYYSLEGTCHDDR